LCSVDQEGGDGHPCLVLILWRRKHFTLNVFIIGFSAGVYSSLFFITTMKYLKRANFIKKRRLFNSEFWIQSLRAGDPIVLASGES
jgi:hypothetical protein